MFVQITRMIGKIIDKTFLLVLITTKIPFEGTLSLSKTDIEECKLHFLKKQ